MNGELPVDVFHWALSLAPVIVLLVLLAGLHWTAPQAGPVGLFMVAVIAVLAFETPFRTLTVATGKGIWDALFILLVIWPALLLYRVVDRAGALEALRRGIAGFSRNELFLVLAFGWVFASFLQGIAGFGAPIAVVAPLLLALGVRPVYAVVIPLIGHAWANLFGTLGVAWLATLQVVELENETRTAVASALLLSIGTVSGAVTIAWLFGRGRAVTHAAPLIAIVGALHAGVQLGVVLFDPVLANLAAVTAALVALYPLSHWSRYDEPPEGVEARAMEEGEHRSESDVEPEPVMGVGMALMPYAVLAALAVAVLVPAPVRDALDAVEIGIPFPQSDTGFGVTNEAEDEYSPFAPLTHPGIFLLAAAVVAAAVFRARGKFRAWEERAETKPVSSSVVEDALPASIAIVTFLALSQILEHSGQTAVLAQGVAAVTAPAVYVFLSPWIGGLGSFVTSSNASSNILFSPLQLSVAETAELSEASVIGGQHAGGAVGNAASPANVVLGTSAAGIVGEEGRVLRITLVWAGATLTLVGAGSLGLYALGIV